MQNIYPMSLPKLKFFLQFLVLLTFTDHITLLLKILKSISSTNRVFILESMAPKTSNKNKGISAKNSRTSEIDMSKKTIKNPMVS